MSDCTIAKRDIIQKLTVPVTGEDLQFKVDFYHDLIKEADPTLPGSELWALISSGRKLTYHNTWYVEWFQTYKPVHHSFELEQQHHQVDKRHTNVKLGHRKSKCRFAYASSWSYHPRDAKYYGSEEEWNRQNECNFLAYLKSFKLYDTYKVLKIFTGSEDNIKKIIGENSKCNYIKEIVDMHESKNAQEEYEFSAYVKSLEQMYNNAKGAENLPGGVLLNSPLCVKADGSITVTASEMARYLAKHNPNKLIFETLNKIIYSNTLNATTSNKKFIKNLLEDNELKWVGAIDKLKEIIREVTTKLTTKYNLAHNNADISKCSNVVKDNCAELKKIGVYFMNCCCSETNSGECFCEMPKIRQASSLVILVNPMTIKTIDAMQAIFAGYKGYELTSENLGGITIIQSLCYPEDQISLAERGFMEFCERYNVENEGNFKTPDVLQNKTRHIEQEIITRFDKVFVTIKIT